MKSLQNAISVLVVSVLFISASLADVPRIISYQGRLKNTSGVPYNGSKNTTFVIYDGGGASIWNSGAMLVTYDSGLCAVKLGASPQPALPTSNWASDTGLTLGITVDPDPEISPRTRFTTVGYAMHAKDADKLDGLEPAAVASLSGWYDGGPVVGLESSADQVVIGQAVPSFATDAFEVHAIGNGNTASRFEADGSGATDNALLARSTGASGIAGIFIHDAGSVTSTPSALAATTQTNNAYGIQSRTTGDNSFTISAHNNGSTGGAAIYGWSAKSYSGFFTSGGGGKGLYADSDSSYGGEFMTDFINTSAAAVYGHYDHTGTIDGKGVYGRSVPTDFYGYGGYFQGGWIGSHSEVISSGSDSYFGVEGEATGSGGGNRFGVYGRAAGTSGLKYGVYGEASGGGTNYGVYSVGNCHITGTLTKGAGAFKIDHPLDPENKYLQHSFVESPDMKNIYDGVAVLDKLGRATIKLPQWFEALNRDFRYQLTCIGGFAPVYIEGKVKNNSFSIAGGKAGMEVSWQVTGIRKDAYAVAHPIEVEVVKAENERGLYQNPEAFGISQTKGIDYVRQNEHLDKHPEKKAALEQMKNSKPPVQGKPSLPTPVEVIKVEAPSNN